MTGSFLEDGSLISEMTIFTLIDSGLYRSLEAPFDKLTYGKNRGCDFVENNC